MQDLRSIGMERGSLYETILTTKNRDRIPNAAPIGVICKSETEVVLHLFEGTHTLENIKSSGRFVVNILKDPTIFVQSTLGDLSSEYFNEHEDDFYIENSSAFFTVKVKRMKTIEKKDDLGVSKLNIVNASLEEIIIKNRGIEPLNRAIYAILESLVYLSRMDMADEKTREEYRKRISEMSRMVNRTGGKEHKEAMQLILKYLKAL